MNGPYRKEGDVPARVGATYVYVSNAEDGDIGVYAMDGEGELQRRKPVEAGKPLGPMCVSPDQRYLFAAVRANPYRALIFAIDRSTSALKPLSEGRLADSFPYIAVDRTGRYLLGASYSGHKISVNAIDPEGRISEPIQVIHTAVNAHAIITDRTNRYVFAPHLGTDQIFQFHFDARTGKLTENKPPSVQMRRGTGPRHIIVSGDNRFAYLLNELTGTVTTLSLDRQGLLSPVDEASILPPDSKLRPGAPRGAAAAGGGPRDVSKDIWASDLHLTPDGRHLYAAERTSSTIGAFSVEADSGHLCYLGSTPTEKQQRGFRIDPQGRFLVASGELSDTLSVYAIAADGALRLLQRCPAGRSAHWVEIVSFV
jgi:6-phosphogluconolactonase